MQQSRQSNTSGGYRIKKQRNNFLGDSGHRDQQDLFKMSIHSSSHKSPGNRGSDGKKKRNHSTANKNNDLEKYSYRSKKSNLTKSNLSSNSLTGSHKRHAQQDNGHIKQFANVKQLLMIKAYDKKLFRKVTGSNEANKNFLKLGDVRNDPFRKETLKVMIENFKQITMRIRTGYNKVLRKILFQNTNASAIVTLASVQPILQKVRQQSDLMYFKVKECLQVHQSREFRSLLLKFQTFLNASQQIEDIILIVSQSKNRIDDLFKNLQRQNRLDEKVDHERRRGIKKVRNAVRDYGDDDIQAKILDRVQLAINEMADKTLEAYSKITGVRGLMMRLKECLKQNKEFYDLDDIVKFNKIFKQVLIQAENYQRFADKFMQEGDIVNDDLRQCIVKYREEVEVNKNAVYQMQLKFVSNIIETLIQSFEANYSVCNVLDSNLSQDYNKVKDLLEPICGCILDENVKINIRSMSRDIDHDYKAIQKLIKKIQRTPKSIAIDTHHGLQTLVKTEQYINEFKKNVRQIIQRSERAHKQIVKKRVRRQNIQEPDLEQKCIQSMIQLSKKLNNLDRKRSIENCKSFKDVQEDCTIGQVANEIGDAKFYMEFKNLLSQIQQLNHNNELNTLISELKTEDKIYQISPFLLEIHKLATSINQSNLLKSLQNINSKYTTSFKQPINIVYNFIERVFAVAAFKGLDKQMVKKIDNNKSIEYPVNQHDVESLKRDAKYLRTVCSIMPETFVKEKISQTEKAMEQMIQGIKITEEVKWNKDGLYYIDSKVVFQIIANAFQNCFKSKQQKIELKNVQQMLKKIGHNIDKLQKKQNESGYHKARIQKVMVVLNKYESINNKIKEHINRIQNLQLLQCYSQLVFCFTDYLKSTLQSFHATLNKENCILWLCQYPIQKPKISSFGSQIGLTGLKSGQYTQKYNEKTAIKARKQKLKQKQKMSKKDEKKKKPKDDIEIEDDLDEQIQSEDGPVDDLMGQQIDQDNEIDEMDDVVDQMGQDIQEMDQQMGEDIPEDDLGQMIKEADQDIIDDLEDDAFVLKKNKNRPSAARNKDHQNQSSTKKTEESPLKKTKQQQKIKQQQKQIIVIKQKKGLNLFEVFKYIQTLQDLKQLFNKMNKIRQNFWSQTDFLIIQKYFNRDTDNEIHKNLSLSLEKFCKTQFHIDFYESLKNSDGSKQISKQIDDLNLLKFAVLCQILAKIKKNYSCFIGFNKQLLRLSIKNSPDWQPKICIEQFVKKQLAISKQEFRNFDCEGYTKQMINSIKGYQVKYELGDKNMMIKGEDLKQKIQEHQKIIKAYQDISKFPDGTDLQLLIQNMWNFCGSHKNKQDYQKVIKVSDKFYNDIKTLETGQNFNNAIYYFINLKQLAKKSLAQMEQYKKKLKKLFEDLSKDNLLQSIKELVKIYRCEPSRIINFQNKPVMYRSIEQQKQNNQNRAIRQLLLPKDKKITNLNSQNIRTQIRQFPQLYVQLRKQICSILSLLQLQSHIWPAETKLYISQTRDETLKLIIAHISNNLIKDAHEELQNLQQINDSLIVVNVQNLVFEYAIKQDKKIMDINHNADFYNNFVRVSEQYKLKTNGKLQVSDCIFQSLFGLQDVENSVTTQIFDYTQTLSMILKQKMFTEDWNTIFNYHIPTQNKIQQIKKNIDSQVRLLLKIVEQSIEIDPTNNLNTLIQIQNKNKLIIKWYNEHKGKQEKDLKILKICLCSNPACDGCSCTLYVGQTSQRHFDYIKRLTTNTLIPEKFLKKHIKQGNKQGQKWKQALVLHIGKAIKQICQKLVQSDPQLFTQFINKYNIVHIVKKQQKNKSLSDIYSRLVKLNKNKTELGLAVNQIVESTKKNGILHKIVLQMVQNQCSTELAQIVKNNQQEQVKISQVKIDKTQYTKFGNWVIHIAGKIYKFPFYIMVDKQNHNEIVCFIPASKDEQVKAQLKNLQLPTEFKISQVKNSYKKIHLNQQTFKFKLDQSSMTKQQLNQLLKQNFGIVQNEDADRQTWVLGAYRKTKKDGQEDQYLLSINYIKDELLSQGKQIQISINQFQTKADIEFKILEVKWKEGQNIGEDNIIRQIKSQRYTAVNLNDQITLTALTRWLSVELKKILQKKQAERQQFILKQQKQKEEEQARIKAKQEQQRKKKEQQAAKFVLQEGSSKTITEQTKASLGKLYEQLIKKQIYIIEEDKILKSEPGSRGQIAKMQMGSKKNLQIRTETQKSIIKVENSLTQDKAKQQFHNLAQEYLHSIEQFIAKRQKIIDELLESAKKQDLKPSQSVSSSIQHEQLIINEMENMPGYNPQMKPKLSKLLRALQNQKSQILASVYKHNKDK